MAARLAEDHLWSSIGAPCVRTLLVSPCMRMTLERDDFLIGNVPLNDTWLLPARESAGGEIHWWAAFSPGTPYELTAEFVLSAAERLATDPSSVLADGQPDAVVELFSEAGWQIDHSPHRLTLTSPGGETTVLHTPERPERALTFSMRNRAASWSGTSPCRPGHRPSSCPRRRPPWPPATRCASPTRSPPTTPGGSPWNPRTAGRPP
ncbi:hypothetical protein [Kitasatospora sp. NPDC057015]|uniref:hypothetical protein n=1 Tax=Kitasatospora sp. NPDC057015 TaxID=3346001 RepID=UPI00363906A0